MRFKTKMRSVHIEKEEFKRTVVFGNKKMKNVGSDPEEKEKTSKKEEGRGRGKKKVQRGRAPGEKTGRALEKKIVGL